MIEMELQDKKTVLIKLISNIENDSVIDGISSYLRKHLPDFWNEMTEQERNEVELGLSQLNDGKGIDLEDYLKKVS